MDSFDNLLKAACHIKSYQLGQDKKKFESLPDFYKTGLYLWQMLDNVHRQTDFNLKKMAYEVHRSRGIELVKEKNYDDASYSFCKALAIWKYITSKNPNWKTEGIKDEELQYVETKSIDERENEEIRQMKISALLNIALCELNLCKYDETRSACDEVLRLDNTNTKAYYRRAKTYFDCKASTLANYELALKDLESAVKFDNMNNKEIASLKENLTDYIAQEKKKERKVFKSFFRNVNDKLMEKENVEDNQKNFDEKTSSVDENKNSGKPQLKMLHLIIDLCHSHIDYYDRMGNNKEKEKLQMITHRAKQYRDELQKLIEIDFSNPNEELRKFALKESLNLKDPQVQQHFKEVKNKYIDEINRFHTENLNLIPKDKGDSIMSMKGVNKQKASKTIKKGRTNSKSKLNLETDKHFLNKSNYITRIGLISLGVFILFLGYFILR